MKPNSVINWFNHNCLKYYLCSILFVPILQFFFCYTKLKKKKKKNSTFARFKRGLLVGNINLIFSREVDSYTQTAIHQLSGMHLPSSLCMQKKKKRPNFSSILFLNVLRCMSTLKVNNHRFNISSYILVPYFYSNSILKSL